MNSKPALNAIFASQPKWLFVGILCLLYLFGCANATKEEQTIGSLQAIKIDTSPQPLPQDRQQDARKRYEKVLKSTNNQELKARAMERLADLQLDGHQTKKAETEEQQIANAGPDKRIVTTASSRTEEDADYEKVAQQYEFLLKRNPNSPDNERILYQLGRAHDLGGNQEKALEVLTRLVTEFPKTEKLLEIQFRRGEILFILKRFEEAEKAYTTLVRDQESGYYERALYKLGWCQFKQSKHDRALISFYNLLDYYFDKKQSYERLSRSEKEIVDDTYRVISLTYSFQNGAETIYEFTKSYGERHYVSNIYENLAQLYLKQERYEDTANVYLSYVKNFPNSHEAPLFMTKIINIYKKGGFPTALIKAKEDFVQFYGVGKEYWAHQDRQLFQEIEPSIRSNIEELAQYYHAAGQKTRSKSDYKKAAYWYQQYVASFPVDKKTPAMNFLLADSLIDSRSYAQAATEYEQTAYRYPISAKSAEAGYAAILAHQSVMEELKKNPNKIKNIDKAIENQRKSIINASLKFADYFPKDKRVPLVVIKSAEELLDMKLYPDASAAAQRVTKMKLDKGNEKELVQKAWAIIATAEFEQGNHKAAELASIERLKSSSDKDENRKALVERLAASIYKQGEAARSAGNLAEAAEQFLRIGSLAPSSSVRLAAEYDAAAAFVQLESWDRSIAVLSKFIESYPNDKLTPGAYEKLALAYEKSEKWGEAAAVYAKIYSQETDGNRKRSILWLSAELFEKAGRKPDAMEVYKEYVKNYNQPVEQSVEARQKIADFYLEQKQTDKRHFWLEEIIKADAGQGATNRTHFLAATAALELAGPKYDAYQKVRLVAPLKKNLKIKKELLEQTVSAYTSAANYGIAEITTASTYRIAEVYNNFSAGLYESERPKGLSPEELEQYDLLLEEQAYPFEEKAIEIHETNASRVATGVYDEWVKKSFSALRKLNPIRYSKNERSELFNQALN